VATKSFGWFCVTDSECAGGVCFHKRADRASGRERRDAGGEALEPTGYCSMRCNVDLDCPTPPTSGRCGARGMCKAASPEGGGRQSKDETRAGVDASTPSSRLVSPGGRD
jgi:hypothetical protein